MVGYTYSISLRISHPSRTVADLAAELQLTTTRMWEAGAPRATKGGTALVGVYKNNFWTAKIMEGSSVGRDLASALTDVLEKLSPKGDFLINLAATGGKTELFIGWFFDGNSGDVLDHKLLGPLAELCIDLSFDVYP
jgi:hypothetical protein